MLRTLKKSIAANIWQRVSAQGNTIAMRDQSGTAGALIRIDGQVFEMHPGENINLPYEFSGFEINAVAANDVTLLVGTVSSISLKEAFTAPSQETGLDLRGKQVTLLQGPYASNRIFMRWPNGGTLEYASFNVGEHLPANAPWALILTDQAAGGQHGGIPIVSSGEGDQIAVTDFDLIPIVIPPGTWQLQSGVAWADNTWYGFVIQKGGEA